VTDRPSITPDVLASVTEDVPARVRRRLDKEPDAAATWDWTQTGNDWSIDTGSEAVTLKTQNGLIASREDVGCSCLLSPRCYHLLACLSVLEVESDIPASEAEPADVSQAQPSLDSTTDAVELDVLQLEAARRLSQELAKVIAVGARSVGALIQAQLMRALHECRSLKLYRLSASGLRVLQHIRQLRSNDDQFDSAALVVDLRETLELTWRLTTSQHAAQDWIGTARRAYFPIESLSLQALFSEPVLTATGHSGVVTYLMDPHGTVYSVSNVRPGEPSRVFEAWQNDIDLGGLSVTHRELSRSGLLLQQGTASRDGRLGAGQGCRAITKSGDGWSATSVEQAFSKPVDQQIARVFASARDSLTTRRAGWDFMYLRGRVVGTDGKSLVLQTEDGHPMFLRPASESDDLRYRENIEMLSRCPRLPLRMIARLDPSHAGRLIPLAIAPDENPQPDSSLSVAELQLPAGLSGHVSLGLERLKRAHLSTAGRDPVQVPVNAGPPLDDGLAPLRHQVRELALGGRHSLPTRSVSRLAGTCSRLSQQGRPTAALLLQNLASVAIDSESSISGQRFPTDPSRLARLWLATSHYISASTSEFEQTQWQRLSGTDALQ
jgi:hypothetical protein